MWVANFFDEMGANNINQAIDRDHDDNALKATARLVEDGACSDTKKIRIPNGDGQGNIFG